MRRTEQEAYYAKLLQKGCFSVHTSRTLLGGCKGWIRPKHKLLANPTAAGLSFALGRDDDENDDDNLGVGGD